MILEKHKYINIITCNMSVYNFDDFCLNESKKNTKTRTPICNIIFVTKNPVGENTTGEYSKFKNSCNKYGVNIYPVDVDKIQYKVGNDNRLIIEGVGEFSKNNTFFIFRHSVRLHQSKDERAITMSNLKSFKRTLTSLGFSFANNAMVINVCRDKFKTYVELDKSGVDCIPTFLIDKNIFNKNGLMIEDNLKNYVSSLGIDLPVVLKVVDGTQGKGVYKCENMQELLSILSNTIETNDRCILQPFCDIDYDVRVHVFCKTLDPKEASANDFVIVGSMKREKAEGDFRTNYSVGGNISAYTLSREESELAKKAAKAIGAVWCGVDICFDKNSKKYYVIEVNSSPALKGITSISSTSPTDVIVENVKKALEKNLSKEYIEDRDVVSYHEMVKLDGIEIEGCFDTGNSAVCALKTNHFVEHGDELEFEIGDHIITKKIIKRKKILHGGIKSDERPVVLFDITFNDKTIKGVEVCIRELTDTEKKREDRTKKKLGGKKILLSASVIDKLGLVVHPDRDLKFLKSK